MSSRRQISIPLGGRYRQVSMYMAQYFNLSVVETGIIREIKSIPWLLMLRLLSSPGHQQLWYWLCMISVSLSFMRTGFNYMPHLNVDEWNVNTMFLFFYQIGQNGHHFADDIFRYIFVNESFVFWSRFHWTLFLRVQLTITQHWFR